jgi:hypothetical protein
MVQLKAEGGVTAASAAPRVMMLDTTTKQCLANAVLQPAAEQGVPVASHT